MGLQSLNGLFVFYHGESEREAWVFVTVFISFCCFILKNGGARLDFVWLGLVPWFSSVLGAYCERPF